MPNVKQPPRLEQLALHSSATSLYKLAEIITPGLNQNASIGLQQKVKYIRELFEFVIPHSLFDEFCLIIFKQIPTLIGNVKRNISFTELNASKFMSKINVFVSLTEILISPKMRILNFEYVPKLVRHLFYSRMSCLTGLKHLNMGSVSGGWKTDDMEPTIIRGIETMSNLQVLVLNYDCTDNIIEILSHTCPQLHTIDISSSKYIDNDSMDILIQLKNLRNVQLYRTSVTIEGYVKLLLKLEFLEDIGRYDELGRCLEYIDDNYPDKDTFSLTKFESRYVTIKHLTLLCKKCPEIRTVSIFHNSLLSDLMLLIGLNNLRELYLMSCDFFADQIRDVLEVKGCNITHLHLEHVDEIDMNALMYISQFCPDLKTLTLYNCYLIESTSLYTRRLPIPPFMNLERLTVASKCSLQHLEFILGSAFKIKYIHFGATVHTSDNLFGLVLPKNPLQYLEILRIVSSTELTIDSAYKLIETCSSLKILTELESWTAITPRELEQFKQIVARKNLDVDITPLRFFSES